MLIIITDKSDKLSITIDPLKHNKAYVYVEKLNSCMPVNFEITSNTITFNAEQGKVYIVGNDLAVGSIISSGWNKINNQWFVLKDDGSIATGWHKDTDGKWYMLDNSGAMKTGWHKDTDGKWYMLDNTGAMKTGWHKDIDGKWYYLKEDGSMAVNESINGYTLNENGAWIE